MIIAPVNSAEGAVPALRRLGWGEGWSSCADLVRAAALLSILAGAVWFGPAETARFTAVFLGLLVPRRFGIPGPLDSLFCSTVLLATWSGAAGWYQTVEWLDDAAHFITNGTMAAVAYLILARLQIVHEVLDHRAVRRSWLPVAVLTAALGLALGAIWEFIEWLYKVFEPATVYGYADTVGDMALGGLGALIAGVGLRCAAASRPGAAAALTR